MLQLQRLNMDNSWWLKWGNTSLLLDPWLIESEVDGFKWFNEQWHATPAIAPEKVPAYQHVLISQPYSDHCHTRTLRALHLHASFWAVPAAVKRLKKEWPEKPFQPIYTTSEKWLTVGELTIARLTPARWVDPIYHAIVIARNKEAVVYAPHGFMLTPQQKESIAHLDVKLLITTFTHFTLPFFLGGTINPGKKAAMGLASQLQAKKIVNTHDEDKIAKGLVIKLAKRTYENMAALALSDKRIVHMGNYEVYSFA